MMGAHVHRRDDHDHSEHGHFHSHFREVNRENSRAVRTALSITIVFMFAEFAGGWIANSLSLITDAVHMLADAGALGVSLIAFWLARRPRSAKLSYGYHRAEILGALFSGLLIWGLSGILIYEAIERFQNPQVVEGKMVVFIALMGLFVNLLSMRVLRSADHEHNLNLRAAYLHVLGDMLGSVGAVISGVVIWATGWWLADPIVTVVFALLVLYSAWRLVRDAVGVLMESVPRGINATELEADLRALASVREVHDLHVWSVSSGLVSLSAHLVAEDSRRALGEANELLRAKYGIRHTTIQVETPEGCDSEHCEGY